MVIAIFVVLMLATVTASFILNGQREASDEYLIEASSSSPCAWEYLSRIAEERIITRRDVTMAYKSCNKPKSKDSIHLSQKEILQQQSPH